MKPRAVNLYVATVILLAILSLRLVPWGEAWALTPDEILGLFLLMGFGLISEKLSVGMSFNPQGASHSITFIPLLASVLLFGPSAAVLLMALAGGIAEIFFRKKPAIKASFNVAQYVLATSVAGWAFSIMGGMGRGNLGDLPDQLIPFFTFQIVFMSINHGAVSLAIALSQALPFKEVWGKFTGPSGVNALYDLLVSPLAIVVAFLYSEAGAAGLALSLFPLLFIRHAYLNNHRLEQANRDLLKALVKAIETRDPYTSGHSQRVAWLAGRICRQLNLNVQKTEEIEMAALLHDIGKIDVVYSAILRKPSSLSPEERSIMESHVTKGVELLSSLSSVPESVIQAVRHHHEKEDGTGYPDQLSRTSIPLGAKIIKVCDAIDAMLSDRPYRPALTVGKVKDELWRWRDRDFDASVVASVVESDLLQEHAAKVSNGGSTGEGAAAPPPRSALPKLLRPRHARAI